MNIAALLSPTVAAPTKGAPGGAAGPPGSAFAALFAVGAPDGAVPIPASPQPVLQAVAVDGAALPVVVSALDMPATSLEPIAAPALVPASAPAPAPAPQTVAVAAPKAPLAPLAVAVANTELEPALPAIECDGTSTDTDDTAPAQDDEEAAVVPPQPPTPVVGVLMAVSVAAPVSIAGQPSPRPVTGERPTPLVGTPNATTTTPVADPAAAAPTIIQPGLPQTSPAMPVAVLTPAPTETPQLAQQPLATAPAQARQDASLPAAPMPQPAIPAAPITSGPALQVFGAAIAATREAGRTEPVDSSTPSTWTATAVAAAAPIALAPAGEAQQAPLDLTHQRWPHAMIDRIEQVRDIADAADTSIRLIPDALGTVDVAVRREGDTLHVHFTAAESQTRALLQDAQPRLVAAAEERGLRLGQTAVDGGTAGQPQQQSSRGQPQAQPARAPASARPTSHDRDPATDGRVA